jgi:23S rRNA pseudouridine1911/1915/1917 synthase
MPEIRLTVEPLDSPQRIDTYIASCPLGLSRSLIKRLFGEGRVIVAGRKVRVSHKVSGGEEVIIEKPEQRSVEFKPEDIPLDIVYQDDHLAVVDKPAGLVVHPATRNEAGTMANALLHHFQNLSGGYKRGYPGLVHRLDKNTSGLLVVAKNDTVHAVLGEQLRRRSLKREYLALVWGHMRPDRGTISMPLGRSISDRRIMSPRSHKLRDAVTHYSTLETFTFLSLVGLRLETGRTHQIRAHLRQVGHSVFGDPEYGGRSRKLSGIEAGHRSFARKLLDVTDRQLLHATRLEFAHPENGEPMVFESSPPKDFAHVLSMLRP